MSFEPKHLIRWGMPGWVMIFWFIYYYIALNGFGTFKVILSDLPSSLSLIVSLTLLGTLIGYIVQQIYFGAAWVWNRRKDYNSLAVEIGDKFPKDPKWGENHLQDYFQFEYVWHMMLLNQNESTRKYIEGRYRHILGYIHNLGTFFFSQLISLLCAVIFICSFNGESRHFYLIVIIGVGIKGLLLFSAGSNFNYYSNNLKAFQTKILKTYL